MCNFLIKCVIFALLTLPSLKGMDQAIKTESAITSLSSTTSANLHQTPFLESPNYLYLLPIDLRKLLTELIVKSEPILQEYIRVAAPKDEDPFKTLLSLFGSAHIMDLKRGKIFQRAKALSDDKKISFLDALMEVINDYHQKIKESALTQTTFLSSLKKIVTDKNTHIEIANKDGKPFTIAKTIAEQSPILRQIIEEAAAVEKSVLTDTAEASEFSAECWEIFIDALILCSNTLKELKIMNTDIPWPHRWDRYMEFISKTGWQYLEIIKKMEATLDLTNVIDKKCITSGGNVLISLMRLTHLLQLPLIRDYAGRALVRILCKTGEDLNKFLTQEERDLLAKLHSFMINSYYGYGISYSKVTQSCCPLSIDDYKRYSSTDNTLKSCIYKKNIISLKGSKYFTGTKFLPKRTLPEKMQSIDLREMQSIDLSYNKFSVIPKKAFGSIHCRALDLGNCGITTIEGRAFEGANVDEIRLQANNIERIDELAFVGIINLTDLNLANNNIEYIDPKALALLANLKGLKFLCLTDNKLAECGDEFCKELIILATYNVVEGHLRGVSIQLHGNPLSEKTKSTLQAMIDKIELAGYHTGIKF